jgi:hypothetical protein
MFIATALAYPCVLALLCTGAGLLADRIAGGWLEAALLPVVGGAALIALTQLATFVAPISRATPFLAALAALAGLVWGRSRLRELWERRRLALIPVAVYAAALAPVLLSGRATFSSFMALSDSAVHMIGADFLIRHGQDYSHLDLRNSYGQFIANYYDASYPSGADTLFGASSYLLGLPLIWSFQPFNAFLLAIASGPAWVLAQRLGLRGAWAAAAAVTSVLGATVYAYALLGSVKELAALAMILALGALVAGHERWLRGPPRRAIPFALVVAAGVSALGVGFGVWALVATVPLAVAVALDTRAHADQRSRLRLAAPALGVAIAGIAVLALAALPTWSHTGGSLHVAQAIASTSNPGNLHAPLKATQLFGIWLNGSYKLSPGGAALTLTRLLIALAGVAAVAGAVQAIRQRAYAIAGWIACSLVAWIVVTESVTTWGAAKALVLTAPIVLLLAWVGLAAAGRAPRGVARTGALVAAAALVAGVLASDVLQYRASNVAPTRRYNELGSLAARLHGSGPTLFTDFDEYAMYQLRHADIAGPDFVYPPPALAATAGGYGNPVRLDSAPPAALPAYPVIVTRRDPTLSRPPAAYRLQWQGAYYQVWRRTPLAPAALAHVALGGTPAQQCARIGALAGTGGRLYAAPEPPVVAVPLARSSHPARWGHQRGAIVMNRAGTLVARFELPAGGRWHVWIQGQLMPRVRFAVDGKALAVVSGQLSGNSLVPDTLPPITVPLAAGGHTLTITRGGATLAPGDGGAAVLTAVLLTPAAADPTVLRSVASSSWRSLCGGRYRWVEVVG